MTEENDPFAAVGADRTFIIPSPGQRAAQAAAAAAASPPAGAAAQAAAGAPPTTLEALAPASGLNPLVAAASPLLNLVPQLRRTLTHPDPARLRDTLVHGLRAFETRARAGGIAPEKIIAARYILCTLLDETVASTPWGGSGVWARQSLLVMFHNEAWGGEKVFQLLAKLVENPDANIDLLELMYVVMAFGLEGRYRVVENGRAQLDQVRERLYAMVRGRRGEFERELSPRWQGVREKRNIISSLPMWIPLALVAFITLALYLGLSYGVNRSSDPVFAAVEGLHGKVPPPAPPPPAPKPRLATFLAPEIRQGLVTVADFGDRSVVTIRGDGFFEPGSASVSDKVLPLLGRIGAALNSVPGSVLIAGHTDNQPIRSVRFPSNWHLSQARADAVEHVLAGTVTASRMKAEGRGDGEPVASNDTPAGRSQNRRVDITLFVGAPN